MSMPVKHAEGSGGNETKAQCCLSFRAMLPNEPFHLTAARLRIWVNAKDYGWAAAGDRRALASHDN